MTLNVIVQNMVAVDSEQSFSGSRTSDDVEKSEIFSGESYHGVLVGNGRANVLVDTFSLVRQSNNSTLNSLLEEIKNNLQNEEKSKVDEYLNSLKEKITRKYALISDPEKREGATVREYSEEVEKALTALKQERPQSMLYVIAFDKQVGRLCKYVISCHMDAKIVRLDFNVIADGSGGDFAQAFISTQTSGLNWDTVSPEQTFYLITLGCAAATGNAGVGGFMRVALVGESEVKSISGTTVNAAVRVCAKQIAGNLSKKEAMDYTSSIYNDEANIEEIAQRLDITPNDLLYSPGRLHQDVAKYNALMQK